MTAEQETTPLTPNGGYDVVTGRILVSGLLACELTCVIGMIACQLTGVAISSSISHLASGMAGALTLGVGWVFKSNGRNA